MAEAWAEKPGGSWKILTENVEQVVTQEFERGEISCQEAAQRLVSSKGQFHSDEQRIIKTSVNEFPKFSSPPKKRRYRNSVDSSQGLKHYKRVILYVWDENYDPKGPPVIVSSNELRNKKLQISISDNDDLSNDLEPDNMVTVFGESAMNRINETEFPSVSGNNSFHDHSNLEGHQQFQSQSRTETLVLNSAKKLIALNQEDVGCSSPPLEGEMIETETVIQVTDDPTNGSVVACPEAVQQEIIVTDSMTPNRIFRTAEPPRSAASDVESLSDEDFSPVAQPPKRATRGKKRGRPPGRKSTGGKISAKNAKPKINLRNLGTAGNDGGLGVFDRIFGTHFLLSRQLTPTMVAARDTVGRYRKYLFVAGTIYKCFNCKATAEKRGIKFSLPTINFGMGVAESLLAHNAIHHCEGFCLGEVISTELDRRNRLRLAMGDVSEARAAWEEGIARMEEITIELGLPAQGEGSIFKWYPSYDSIKHQYYRVRMK